MKTIDRIFIASLVIIICLSGIYATKSFRKGWEAINVAGNGQVEAKANHITMNINAIFSGSLEESQKQREQETKKLEEELKPLGFKITRKNQRFRNKVEGREEYCYTDYDQIKTPCLDSYMTIEGTGDKVIEHGQKLTNLFNEKRYRKVNNTKLSIDDAKIYEQEAAKLALQNAQGKAKETAKILGVKLGKLLQTTEYGTPEDSYEGGTYMYAEHFYNGEELNSKKTVTISKNAYLTYEIK